MSFSYYEIYITSLRAFSGMGFPYGADEDAAYMTTWLELYKLGGIHKLASLSNILDNKYNAKFDLKKVRSTTSINLYNTSLLMKGPGLFDYLFQKTKKNNVTEIVLDNCIDPIYIIPLAQKYSDKLEIINACWINDQNKKIGVNISKKQIAIGQLKTNKELTNKQVLLQFIKKNDKSLEIKKLKLLKIEYEINNTIKQQYLRESLNPNPHDWNIISKLAHRTFVPESEESRKKGAGGGNDND